MSNYKVENELEYNCIKSLGNSESLFLAYTFGNKFVEEKAYSGFLFEPIDKNFDINLSSSFIRFKKTLVEFGNCLQLALQPLKQENENIAINSNTVTEIHDFLRLLIKICSSSGAYANLNVIIEFPQKIFMNKPDSGQNEEEISNYYFKFFIPPITLIVDRKIRECNIYIKWNRSFFNFTEIIESSVIDKLVTADFLNSSYSYERKNDQPVLINTVIPQIQVKSINNEESFESKIARKLFLYFRDQRYKLKNELLKGN